MRPAADQASVPGLPWQGRCEGLQRDAERMKALICGIGGQDGAYLASLLLDKGYEVVGTSRDAQTSSFSNLRRLGIFERIKTVSMAVTDFRSVLSTLKQAEPDEIYYLSGQSSVGLSFNQPVETIDSIVMGTLNMLEAIRFLGRELRLYNAGSGECFGDTGEHPATEKTPFSPQSPYAVAKAAAHNLVATYREAYQLHASTGILYNHESPLRPERFVTQKIIQHAVRISEGSREPLLLGNIDIIRDWGWAPEYVDVMWRMLQQPQPDDYLIATGRSYSLEDFVERTFSHLGLNWREHVQTDASLLRPSDHRVARANPAKASAQLGWTARFSMPDVVQQMVEYRLNERSKSAR
jgi:GDPmannose 4,6-dehydratase